MAEKSWSYVPVVLLWTMVLHLSRSCATLKETEEIFSVKYLIRSRHLILHFLWMASDPFSPGLSDSQGWNRRVTKMLYDTLVDGRKPASSLFFPSLRSIEALVLLSVYGIRSCFHSSIFQMYLYGMYSVRRLHHLWLDLENYIEFLVIRLSARNSSRLATVLRTIASHLFIFVSQLPRLETRYPTDTHFFAASMCGGMFYSWRAWHLSITIILDIFKFASSPTAMLSPIIIWSISRSSGTYLRNIAVS